MNSRVLREIPLRILRGKAGDERVNLLQACYDNPIFDQEDSRAYTTQNGPGRTGKPGDYGADFFEDGMEGRGYSTNCHVDACHVTNDYMHSLPVSPPLRNDIVFRAHRKRSRVILILIVFLVVMAAVSVGLLVHYIGNSTTVSSPLSSSPVLTLNNVQGSLRIIAGPFSVYTPNMADSTSSAFLYLRNAFVFKMDTIFMSSTIAAMYNKTQLLNVSGNKSHLLVSFVIQPQTHFTTSTVTWFIEHIRTAIVNGLKNSVFVIDNDSLELKAVKPAPPQVTPVGECQPVVMTECLNYINYSSTSFPNLLGHKSQGEAQQFFRKYTLLLPQCHTLATEFYCSLFIPECGPKGQPIPPCQKYCQDFVGQCYHDFIKANKEKGQTSMLTCEDFPDSTDPKICKQNPLDSLASGACIPLTNGLCLAFGYNTTSYPGASGIPNLDHARHIINNVEVFQDATKCYKHSVLFACYFFQPPCTGKPPQQKIPVCASLCQEFRDRCEIFMDIFDTPFPSNINCSDFPDSPDPSVCLGYQEAKLDDDFTICSPGELKCEQSRCIKKSWICDGYQDCDDNSDELNCAVCGKDEQSCSPATGQCINKSQGCDGAEDCYMGVDEHFCVQIETNNDTKVLKAFNPITLQWEEVCNDNWNQSMSLLVCNQLGYRNVLTTFYTAANVSSKKSIVSDRKNGSDPNRLQSYLTKGLHSCPTDYVVGLICMDTECGVRPANYKSPLRIVGGSEVRPGVFPWMASLHGGSNEAFFCGSTIINEQWILTAAHCVGKGDVNNDHYRYWTVKAGSTRRLAYSAHRQIRKPKFFIKHPAYSESTVENDVALIKLDKPLAMNDFVRPICLPEMQPETGTRCFAVGWGKNREKGLYYESNLMQVALDVTNWDYCKHATTQQEHKSPFVVTHTMFCAGGSSAHDACQGDSGGPLLCRKENTTDEWYQGGVVSWGIVCGAPNTPGVYTKLVLYTDWILETIANHTGP